MRPFYNTPQPFNLNPAPKKELTPKQILARLENDYENYRDDCNHYLCEREPAIIESFKKRIAEARIAAGVVIQSTAVSIKSK